MSNFLLALEIGPVVEIISAARKTRDLWFGSWMLSELGKAATLAAARECGGKPESVIFPAVCALADLEPESDLLIGDQMLLLVPEGVVPAKVAHQAKQAAHTRWLDLAKGTIEELSKNTQRKLIRNDIWQLQTDVIPAHAAGEVIECYAAWTRLVTDSKGEPDYRMARRRVFELLAGRTACRNFAPAPRFPGIPKSSLDGRRETVLTEPFQEPSEADPRPRTSWRDRQLRLNRGEQLDALGLTRRLFGGMRNYPSTARIAAEPWIQKASRSRADHEDVSAGSIPRQADDAPQASQHSAWTALKNACEELERKSLVSRIQIDKPDKGSNKPYYPQFEAFPFEGSVLYEVRQAELLEESESKTDHSSKPFKSVNCALARLKRDGLGEPSPYYCVLIADGDNIGKASANSCDATRNRQLSKALSQFAAGVPGVVAEHGGASIFAAGEDVAAMLPLHRVIACADQLRTMFEKRLQEFADGAMQPTLSVGVVIGHFLDPLEELLAAGREMEHKAKSVPGKNALAIEYRPRGGAPISIARSWQDDPREQFERWVGLLQNGDLPDKVAYDLRKLAEFHAIAVRMLHDGSSAPVAAALRADAIRLLARKRSMVAQVLRLDIGQLNSPDDLVRLANEIIIARQFANCMEPEPEELA